MFYNFNSAKPNYQLIALSKGGIYLKNLPQMTSNLTKIALSIGLLLASFASFSQEYNSFEIRYQDNIKGDLTFIANQIVNRNGGSATTEPIDGYNNLNTNGSFWPASNRNHETGGRYNYNDYKNMQYIDVDGDPSTFNSSTTTFSFPNPNCNLIRYAGLYWSATYPRDNTTDPVGTPRQHPINQVKLKVPGGAYVDVTADDILYDGLSNPALSANAPYAAYADVTALLTPLANPAGDYTVANIAVAQGVGYDLNTGTSHMPGGSAGGWTLVIVYENPTITGKLITTFDGFARVTSSDQIDINYNGFTTIPVGQVNVDIGAATLEGDFRISGDQMRIRAASNAGFTTMSNGANPANNFFNSNITLNATLLPGRTPSSANTLGYDTDIFTLNNFANSVIPNAETAATFRFQTNGDQYYPFFNSFNVEIIEPDIVLEKKVEDIAGNDITGLGVNLGQTLDYVLSFQNIGNDDGTNYTIRDVLPINVTLDESNFVLPTGVTYTYDAPTRTVLFTIPDNLIETGDPVSAIRMRVRVAENCFDFIDACTDLIQNLAYSTYEGVVNNNQITDDPSVTDFDDCGFITPGATNFLLDDLTTCDFTRTVQLCGDNVILDAGDGFDSYVWYSDVNDNGVIDGSDTILNDGDPDSDPSTQLVTQEGTYIVDKIIADPCKGFQEILVVERFGSNTINPIVDYFNTVNSDGDVSNDIEGEIATCSIDGDVLPKIFLCGAGDTQILQTNITDAQTISWELLDESSCTLAPDDCANKNAGCTWNQIATGSTYTANAAGKYRLVVTYQNGCFNRFYFDVFQNNLNIEYNSRDIICTTEGRINITNLGLNYGFQLIDITNNAILVPFSANNGPDFTITTNGQYRVDVVQLDGSGNPIANACVFSTPDIGILDRNFQVDVATTPSSCNTQGTIKIDILNVEPNYTYVLRQSNGTLIDDETAQTNNTHTFNVNAGNYIIEASTDDGCTFTQNVSVANTPDPIVSATLTRDIGCSAGIITMSASGGFPNPDYGFAIWSKDGTNFYSTISDIPGSAYQVENEFNFGWRDTDFDSVDEYFPGENGTYVFVVVDANGCHSLSNPVTINDNGAMTVSVTDDAPVSCNGSADAGITIVPSGGIGPYTYSIDGGGTTQSTPVFVGLSAGTYPIQVEDSSGCIIDLTHDITESFPLSASAGVSRDATCDPNGAEVRITNVTGGSAPYEYSFDGGGTYGASSIAILAPGTYTVIVRDATACEFPMDVTVAGTPPPPGVDLTPEVNYNCDGTGTITATPSISTYNYTYELDGLLNAPDPTSNVFVNVPPGTYTVRTNYQSATPPTPSLLLSEDFGSGATIPSPNTNGYNYEDQTNNPPGDANSNINDFEYSVTSQIVAPFGSWLSPIDHTSGTLAGQGRYLVMNVGTPTPTQIIYSKQINDIIPNQDLEVSLFVMNLLRQGTGGLDPDLTVEIREVGTGTIVQSIRTGAIPKNTGVNDWRPFNASLNPGANTSLEFVIRSEITGNGGNDFALDDIEIFQIPEVCSLFVETPVTVVGGRVFEANGINSTNASCNGLSDGTITFEVENFDVVNGFDYSVDGGTTYINSTTSPVTTAAIYGAGNHTIIIRKANEITCTRNLSVNITEPTPVVGSASITSALSCTNGGATITAAASGGTPNYTYQLEDNAGAVIGTYDFATNGTNTVFSGLVAGDYIVRVRDNNSCEDPIDSAITISPTNNIAFDLIPTACYSGANDATIQVNVTNGNGGYTFSINGGPWVSPSPTTATSHTFTSLSNGTYSINVSDALGCTGTAQNVTINAPLELTATAPNITACDTSTDITIGTTGGDTNYVYAVVASGSAVVDADFSITNPISVNAAGNYDVYVRDNNGNPGYCTDVVALTVVQDAPLDIAPTTTNVSCFGGSDGSISITVNSGGTAPYVYSIDNGASYVPGTNFPNLSAGTYEVRVRDANNCESVAQNVVLTEPTALVAFAAVTSLVECNPTLGAEVRITNPSGGTLPYEYSFNNGLSYSTNSVGNLPAGNHVLVIRDANMCTFNMNVTVEPQPTPPNFSDAVSYDCTGEGNITITPDNSGFDYTYSLNGTLNTPADSNVFNGVPVGTHTVTVNYSSTAPVSNSILLLESFGTGAPTSITEIDPLFCFEPQDGSPSSCPSFGTDTHIQDGEYSVANTIVNPYTWLVPNEQSGDPNGRYLAVNIGGVAGVNGIMYAKRNIEVVPNRDITISLDAFNLKFVGSTGADPDLDIQLVNSVGTVIASLTTGNIPKSTDPDVWENYSVTLNPGAETNLDIVIRTNGVATAGNDLVLDNILAFQAPEQCAGSDTFDIVVEDGHAFEASITNYENLNCNADNSGTITITADNFGAGGYEYSLDGSTFIGPFTSTEQITSLAAQTYTITVRDVDNPIAGCTQTLNQTLTEPAILIASATITEAFTCNNTGATITASANGGTPTYEYQLENAIGTVITPFQTATTFSNLPAGDYLVVARDTNNCTDAIDAVITIVAPLNSIFTVTPTACYSGANDGSIIVDVTSLPGNGGFQFSINSGAWITPTPATATSYTFNNLANGSYDIDVRDAFGCQATQQTVVLDPHLTATVDVVDISTCNAGTITVTASGGDGNFAYAFIANGTTVSAADFGASNTFNVTTGNDGDYDVYVWDNNAVDPHCEFMQTVTVNPATPITYTANPTDPQCHNGVGSIEINITSGESPYILQIIDLDNGGVSNETNTGVIATTHNYFNLNPGNYTINVTDANSCTVTQTPITINNPDELTATIAPILPAACGSVDPLDFGFQFTGYPTSYPATTTIEFSADGGATWTGDDTVPGTTDRLMGYISGTSVFPSMRTVIGGVEICRTDLPRYIIPFPLDDLDISISTVVVGCNELQVTVQGTAGVPNYEYTYTDDPSTFNIATATWTAAVPGAHIWTGLIPGRTYVFYVRDSTGCVRQSNVNVNDITTNPLEITSSYEPSCSGANDAEITYTITDTDATSHPSMRWEFYNVNTGVLIQTNAGHPAPIAAASSITINGLTPGEYYIVVTEVDSGGIDACVSASENLLIEELNPITASLNKLNDISCDNPGRLAVENITGGGGIFTFTVTGPAPFVTITGTSDNPIAIPANSPAGNYNVRVTDQYGCFADFGPVNFSLTPNPTIDTMVVDNCNSPSTLTISATSSAAQILYSIDSGTTYLNNGGVFNNMAVGNYNISIIDSNGCTDTDTVTIHPILEANVALTKLLDCTVSPDAEITINVTNGSGDYDYQITDGSGIVVTRTGLPSNPFVFNTSTTENYTITVYDNNTSAPECNRSFPIAVPPIVNPIFTATPNDVTCNGGSDGTITINETSNGINPYTYTIAPVLGTYNSATKTFEDVPVGSYTVTGTATNGCVLNRNVVIGEPAAIAVTLDPVLEFGCTTGNNQNSATISVANTIGGSGTYVRYEFINDQGTATTADDVIVQNGTNTLYIETNTLGGSYIINAYDDKGCVGTTTSTILPYVEITDPTVTVTQDLTCTPGNDAAIAIGLTINPTAGATDLSYAVAGTDNVYNAPNQASNLFTGLGIGNYLVTVTNHLTGCVIQTTFEIEDPNTFEISSTVTDVICFGDDGSVSFTINDVINPYAGGFSWQIYESQGTVTLADDVIVLGANGVSINPGPSAAFNIAAGEYRVEVSQDSDPSCVNNAFFIVAGPSAAITANTVITDITCAGNDGVIEIIDVIGGWGDYQYYVGTTAPTSIGDYANSLRFDMLPPGTYQAWVIDQEGCQQEIDNGIVLADPTPIAATLQLNQPNCTNFTGELEVIGVAGGQGSNYTYQLIKNGTAIGAPQNTTIFSGLDAGSYTVEINDQWSCTFTTLPEILYEPIVPLATVVKTIDCTVDSGGQITITQTGGSGNFDYLVTFPDGLTTATNTTGIFTNLTQVGDYIFTITDQALGHACPVNITQNLQDRILPIINIDSFTNVTCSGANDGTITISAQDNGVGPYTFEIISGNGSSIASPILPASSTSNTAIFNNLVGTVSPGITYTIRATGANNCTTNITQAIEQPEPIANVNVNIIEFGCSVGNNSDYATIEVDQPAITGGSGAYVRFVFINDQGTLTTADDVVVQDGNNTVYTETDFAGGTYIINVYDDNGCLGTQTAVILPFVSIGDPTVTVTQDITCSPTILEEIQVGITVSPVTGTPTLEYTTTGTNVTYNQTNNTGIFTNLLIGNYAITITNIDTGCVVQTTHEVIDPDIIEVVATKLTDEECLNNGVDDGSFSVAITNYTGNYNYQVFDNNDMPIAGLTGTGNTSSPLIFSNLPGGLYYVRITETDVPLCEDDSNIISILAPSAPVSATISEQAGPGCSDDKGSILIDPEGGTAPYDIILTNTTTTQSYTQTNVQAHIFTGLSGGDYDVTITDASNCPISDTITLLTPDALVPTIVATPLVCFNGATGTLTASVNTRNVTPNYLYQINRYDSTGSTILTTSANQTSNIFTGLNAGYYSVTVNDDVGCSENTPIIQIVNPAEVEALLIRTRALTCDTTMGVELELSATGGSGTYEYSEDNITWIAMTGSTAVIPDGANINGPLGAGTYRYYVRDAINGCIAVQSNEIIEDVIEPLTLTLDTTAAFINCNGDNTAAIYASAQGGLGNYMYELYTDVTLSATSRIAGPQSLGEFNGLTAGTYFVNVFSEDCTVAAQQVVITEPDALTHTDSVENVLCFGDENGSITIQLTGGAGGYQYAISPNLNQFTSENVFDELAPGNYTVIAQDQNGCFIELQYTITQPEALSVSATSTPEICVGDADGTIDLNITGGTAPYSTRLATETDFVQDRISFTDLSADNYIIFVRDANNCESDTGILVEGGANLSASIEVVYECSGDTPSNYINIRLEDASVIGDVLYALDSTDPADMQLNPDFRNSAPGSHYIAIAHSNGCIQTVDFEVQNFEPLTLSLEQGGINQISATANGGKEGYTFYFGEDNNGSDNTYIVNRTDTYTVRVIDANGCEATENIFIEFIDIEIPNFFTPDGDGQNDVWMPRNQEGFPEILTVIFDRYGREVYRMSLNTPGWNGLYNETELPTGDYWYVIKLRGENDDREFVGNFTLYR